MNRTSRVPSHQNKTVNENNTNTFCTKSRDQQRQQLCKTPKATTFTRFLTVHENHSKNASPTPNQRDCDFNVQTPPAYCSTDSDDDNLGAENTRKTQSQLSLKRQTPRNRLKSLDKAPRDDDVPTHDDETQVYAATCSFRRPEKADQRYSTTAFRHTLAGTQVVAQSPILLRNSFVFAREDLCYPEIEEDNEGSPAPPWLTPSSLSRALATNALFYALDDAHPKLTASEKGEPNVFEHMTPKERGMSYQNTVENRETCDPEQKRPEASSSSSSSLAAITPLTTCYLDTHERTSYHLTSPSTAPGCSSLSTANHYDCFQTPLRQFVTPLPHFVTPLFHDVTTNSFGVNPLLACCNSVDAAHTLQTDTALRFSTPDTAFQQSPDSRNWLNTLSSPPEPVSFISAFDVDSRTAGRMTTSPLWGCWSAPATVARQALDSSTVISEVVCADVANANTPQKNIQLNTPTPYPYSLSALSEFPAAAPNTSPCYNASTERYSFVPSPDDIRNSLPDTTIPRRTNSNNPFLFAAEHVPESISMQFQNTCVSCLSKNAGIVSERVTRRKALYRKPKVSSLKSIHDSSASSSPHLLLRQPLLQSHFKLGVTSTSTTRSSSVCYDPRVEKLDGTVRSCHNRVAYDSKATKMYLFNPDHRRIGSKEQKQRKEQNSFSPSNSAGSDENSPCTVAAASSIVHNSELHRCSHSSLRDVREREDPVARSRYSTHAFKEDPRCRGASTHNILGHHSSVGIRIAKHYEQNHTKLIRDVLNGTKMPSKTAMCNAKSNYDTDNPKEAPHDRNQMFPKENRNLQQKTYGLLSSQNVSKNISTQTRPQTINSEMTHLVSHNYYFSVLAKILSLAKRQSGSRHLQKLLSQEDEATVTYILEQAYPRLKELMVDLYGNYLCQGLFEACNTAQRMRILEIIAPDTCSIASDPRGTHAMQAFITLIRSLQEQRLLVRYIQPHVLYLATHPFGTHVIQHALVCFDPSATTAVFECIIRNLNLLAENPHGVCVVKRCVSVAAEASKSLRDRWLHEALFNKFCTLTLPLSQSPFGNYAIQHAIQTWGLPICGPILTQIADNIIELATQKFSSNVVEQMLAVVRTEEVTELLKHMSSSEHLYRLLNSSYGNFVVKKAFERSELSSALKLLPIWVDATRMMQNKRLKSKWDKTIQAVSNNLDVFVNQLSPLSVSPSHGSALEHRFSSTVNTPPSLDLDQQQLSMYRSTSEITRSDLSEPCYAASPPPLSPMQQQSMKPIIRWRHPIQSVNYENGCITAYDEDQ